VYYSLPLNPTLNSTGFIIMSRIISPINLYSKISEFLFLFNHMHEFLPFYLFIYLFPGVYRNMTRERKDYRRGEKQGRRGD
jgi:hypothetical protein